MGESFYGDISSKSSAYLLKATPYSKETRINFDYRLDKDTFYSLLYTDRTSGGVDETANDVFDQKIDRALRELENEFAKVSVLHIAGYAGCGKTTYVHHLLWTRRDSIGTYDVIDYEGCNRAVEPFMIRIAHLMVGCETLLELVKFLDAVANEKVFVTIRFSKYVQALRCFIARFTKTISFGIAEENLIRAFLLEFENEFASEEEYLSFLFFLDLLILIYDKLMDIRIRPIVMVIDNSDSMSDLSEETILLPAFTKFANNCNYFFGDNLRNDAEYEGRSVRDICSHTKLLIIFTTRITTANRYESVEPDWEDIPGWTTADLPECYYDHERVILRRIEFYEKRESDNFSETMVELRRVRELARIAYHNRRYMRLFNGNIRTCVERLCNIASDCPQHMIDEMVDLYRKISDDSEDMDAANGFLLSLLLNEFKKSGIYDLKLHLSNWNEDKKVSLSRLILTILREKGGRCSIIDIFRLLVPLHYPAELIASTVWDLCEEGRKLWRRLLIFDGVIPRHINDLEGQARRFNERDWNISKYSELVICSAGLAYMEYVVPHFEFMLSRHDPQSDAIRSLDYEPLFAKSSEDIVGYVDGIARYRFEEKIDQVYSDVRGCCRNSVIFAEQAMGVFSMHKDEYVSSSFFNYHKTGWDGKVGQKQTYESRLVFHHIGYVERYRRYLIQKYRDDETMRLLNEKLITRILRYLDLYADSFRCLGTRWQDHVAETLRFLAKIIADSGYSDIETRIQLND